MRRIILWFYCLPIPDAVSLMFLATVLFLLLRAKIGTTPHWKAGLPFLFVCWIAVIIFGTVGKRTAGSNLSEPVLTPLFSYYTALHGGTKEIYRTNFMNVALFYPAGLLGCGLLPAGWRGRRKILWTAAILAMVSIAIEFAQYRFALGLAETDDVIHNTLGALLGAVCCGASIKLHKT